METVLAKLRNWSKSYKRLQRTHFFVNVEGHENIVCFRNVVEYIINEKLQSFKNSIEDKAEWALQTVTKSDEILWLQILSNQLKTFHLLLTAQQSEDFSLLSDFPWTSDYFRGEAESIGHAIAWAYLH